MQTPHPIVEQAVLSLDPDGGAFFAARVREMLEEIDDGDRLQRAVISLVSLAKRLDDAGNRRAADQILDLACTAVDALRTFGAEARRLAEDVTRAKTLRLRAFEGDDDAARAPKYGARPSGTVTLKTILPPRPRRA